jgi:uncharacterized protein YlxP (DUF503 family)
MVVGVLKLTLRLPEGESLKGKRRAVKSLVDRARRRYNVAVAEVERLDSRQVAVIAVACVSNSSRHASSVLQHVLRWVEQETDGWVEGVEIEFL